MNSGKLFQENLKSALQKAKWTQAELAKRTGIPQANISNYIHGKNLPGLDSLDAIAVAFGVPAVQFILDHNKSPIEPVPARHSDFPIEECAKRVYEAFKTPKEPRNYDDKNRYREPISE